MEFTITNGVEVMKQFSRTDRIREILKKMQEASKQDILDAYFKHYNDDTDTASVRATIHLQVGKRPPSAPSANATPGKKNLDPNEFLQKAFNLIDDIKFCRCVNKKNQYLRNYLENIFNNNKQEFAEEIKKNIYLPEEEKVQIEKLNELDLDQFIEGFVRIMGIAFVYKIISPLSTSSDQEVSKILKLDKKKLATILRILNENYIINYFIKLSIDKIKELSESSEEHNPWGEIEKYKDHTIEQLKNSLEKIDNIEKLLDEIKKILVRIASIPTRS